MGYGARRVQNSCGGGCRLANAANRTKFEANADSPVADYKSISHQFFHHYSIHTIRNKGNCVSFCVKNIQVKIISMPKGEQKSRTCYSEYAYNNLIDFNEKYPVCTYKNKIMYIS